MDRAESARLARLCLPMILNREVGSAECVADVASKSVCRLWGGMGQIYEVSFATTGPVRRHRFIVKSVVPPRPGRGRCRGDERKAKSYVIESNFYKHLAPALMRPSSSGDGGDGPRMPVPYHVEHDVDDDRVLICMSVLDGTPSRYGLDEYDVKSVLRWLSKFHSRTWHAKLDHDMLIANGIVQPIGSYWHLETRPDEHGNMSNKGWEGRLKMAAWAIHERLRRDDMQCFIHGDVKDANMLFANDDDGGRVVGMYDVQYCGRAPPSVGVFSHMGHSFDRCTFPLVSCEFHAFSIPLIHSCPHALHRRTLSLYNMNI